MNIISFEDNLAALAITGQFDALRWLQETTDVDIHYGDDYLFRSLCMDNYFEAARAVYELGGVNIHHYDDEAFMCACLNGNLELAQWLYSLDYINIELMNDRMDLFNKCPEPTATWLRGMSLAHCPAR